jgi:cytochrome c biogenesis protein CcdA/thiol-disulfide isomerase/thioredoxin
MQVARWDGRNNRVVELIGIGFLAGIVAGISPCIIPVLPVVLATGATTTPGETPSWRSWGRPVAVVGGLVLSFSLLILVGSEVLSLLHLPQDFLRDAGIALLVLVGLSFLSPPLSALLERPFARIGFRQPTGRSGGFVIGLALGVLLVPCAGPILAAITVVGATHRVGLTAVFLTAAFAIGASVPLLAVALAGSELTRRVKALRERAPRLRQASGVILIGMALAIGLNAFGALQRDLPGYTSALQNHIEGSAEVRQELGSLAGNGHASLAKCKSGTTDLVNCGQAPALTGITGWLNTPGDKPLSLASLRGQVVLVDFWTYSCINCQRTLPHVEAWYKTYSKDGFVVVGVHTPEFAFEHVVSNVRTEAAQLGVRYPVAIDDNYAAWDAYDNEYWPAEYLIDAKGDVRHIGFGEGNYTGTERLIRQLLTDAHSGIALPTSTSVRNETPTGDINPETYVGFERLQYLLPSDNVAQDLPAVYQFPSSLPLGGFGLSGTWTDTAEEATAGTNAQLELAFRADDVYLVLGGTGTLDVSVNGVPTQTIDIGGIPRLYTLFHAGSITDGTLLLKASPGIKAYDFTFG